MQPAAPAVLADPLAHLLPGGGPGGRRVVGLVGLPGAGKSTVAARLVQALNAAAGVGTAVALGMDGFHLSRAQLAQLPDPVAALARRGAPWTFDPQALAQRLQALHRGDDTVCWPDFDHRVGDPVPDAIAVPAGVRLVLVEGLYLLHREHGWALSGLLHECGYLDVSLPTAMARLAARHQAVWGMTAQQAQARIAASDGLNAALVAQTRPRADWLLPEQA